MRMRKRTVGILLAGLTFCLGAHAEQVQAGLRMMTVPGDEAIPVALFYPAQTTAQQIPMGPFVPTVAMHGEPASVIKGLVLISHGTGGSELGHHNLAQRLAQNGYLVAALQHPRDNYRDRSLVATSVFFAERPKQVSRVLDALLADPEWKEKIPSGRIGAIGHSAGGYTVVALAGGVADPARLATHCKPPADDAVFCSLGGETAKRQAASSAPALDYRVADSRIRAVITMAPLAVVFTEESLANIRIPMQIYTAEQDTVLKGKYHGERLHAAIPGAGYEQVVNAGHFAFMAQTVYPIKSDAGDPGENPPGFDRKAFHQRLERDVIAFFDRHLK